MPSLICSTASVWHQMSRPRDAPGVGIPASIGLTNLTAARHSTPFQRCNAKVAKIEAAR